MTPPEKRSKHFRSHSTYLSSWSRILTIVIACAATLLLFSLLISDHFVRSFPVLTGGRKDAVQDDSGNDYLVGVGKADITGPVVEVNMMGYADTSQSGSGLRQRLYCRTFIAGSPVNPDERVAYLVLDTQSGDTAVRYGIIEGLKKLGSDYDVYTRHNGSNLAVTGTHSHSGPGAWLNYLLPQITSRGFDRNSYRAIVDGCVLSIKRAHTGLVLGTLSLGRSTILDANINRSLYAYLANPQTEQDQYADSVDKDITALSFQDSGGKALGVLTWFPVHGTSLYQNNTLITGDNKGVAAYLVEREMSDENPEYVAGFSQSNVGDTSPNTLGAVCEATGLACKFEDSTCNGRTQGCHGRGPFYQHQDQGTKSCYEIGRRQAKATLDLLKGTEMQQLRPGTVSSFHTFVDMSNHTFVSPFNSSNILKTCSAALGYGFAGGTSDGPGAFDFRQGTNDTDDDSPALKNPLWKIARMFVHRPTDEQIKCQSPKPVLLDVGEAVRPYTWTPNVVDVQVQRIGSLLMIIAPGEATTMSGRRWRNAISAAAIEKLDIANPTVVLGGPANTYAHYIATEEEYNVQRYEGASTLFGRHTLAAYINLTTTYLPYLGTRNETMALPPLPLGPQPPININRALSFIDPVLFDAAGLFRKFGSEIDPPDHSKPYKAGDVVTGRFVGANPRNNYRLEGTFAAVEKFFPDRNAWIEVMNDRDWFLVYRWARRSTVLATSDVTIEWEIEEGTEDGIYRFKYYGDAKTAGGSINPFEGVGKAFTIANGDQQMVSKVGFGSHRLGPSGELLT